MTPPFHYSFANRLLIDKLANDIDNGHSTVILGYPGSGKCFLRRGIENSLRSSGDRSIISVDCANHAGNFSPDELKKSIRNEMLAVEISPREEAQDSFLASLGIADAPVILFVSNIDALPHEIARRLLQEMRALIVQPGSTLAAVVSGHYDLGWHVHGPGSEFNVARQYVTQGVAKDAFAEYLEPLLRSVSLETPNLTTIDALWDATGGNGEVLKALLQLFVSVQHHSKPSADCTLNEATVSNLASQITGHHAGDHLLRYAHQLIPLETDCWQHLERLVNGAGASPLLRPAGPPGPLTYSGLAVRRAGSIEFASPIMASLARNAFDSQYLGDLYAQDGNWETAFGLYEQSDGPRSRRPTHAGDRAATARMVDAASRTLMERAAKGSETVMVAFAKTCHIALGIPEVFYFELANSWAPRTCQAAAASTEGDRAAKETLKLPIGPHWDGPVLPATWSTLGACFRLPDTREGRELVVFVGDFQGQTSMPEYSRQLLGRLARSLCAALTLAVHQEREALLITWRDCENEFVARTFSQLSAGAVDGPELLRRVTAESFSALDYKRIECALVDPSRTHIHSLNGDHTPLSLTTSGPWELRIPGSNPHSYVVHHRRAIAVNDTAQCPLVERPVAERNHVKAFAVIPIVNLQQRTIGTIHVERKDDIVPSEVEMQQFGQLGCLIGPVVECADQMFLMRRALDQAPDPHAVFDYAGQLKYANNRSARLFGVEEGWRSRSQAGDQESVASLAEDVNAALQHGRTGRHETRAFAESGFVGAVVAEAVTAPSHDRLGVSLQIEDLTLVYKLISALQLFARAHDRDSALACFVESTGVLGHEWARLYLVDADQDNVLRSHQQRGFDEGSDSATMFENGLIELRRGEGQGEHSLLCIDRRESVVFSYAGHTRQFTTPNGLLVQGTSSPCEGPLTKELGDYWVDVPLLVGETTLGKITLGCQKDLRPEHFEFLKVFFQVASSFLNLSIDHQNASERLIDLERAHVASETLGMISHNLATRFAGFEPLITLYRDLESKCPDLIDHNDLFATAYDEIRAVVDRAKTIFQERPPEYSRCEVRDMLTSMADAAFGPDTVAVQGPEALYADLDPLVLGSAFQEIFRNAAEFSNIEDVAIDFSQFRRDDAEWIRIRVSDRGPGVPQALKQEIFDDFFSRRDSADSGCGLGLSLVARATRCHGGSVREIGEEGVGACFEMEMPRFNSISKESESEHQDSTGQRG